MRLLVVAAALVLGAMPALADGVLTPYYGGQMVEAPDGTRIEFAVRDGGIRVWVREHSDKEIPASAVTGKAALLVGAKKVELPLVADGGKLVAPGEVNSADKVTAILSLTVNGKPVSARFAQSQLAQPASLSGQAQAGKAAFEAVCASCHGKALRGSDNGPPLLHPYYAPGAGHDDSLVLATMTSGAKAHLWKFGDMPKPEGLKPGQDKDILAYVRAMQAANGITPPAQPMMHQGHSGHAGH